MQGRFKRDGSAAAEQEPRGGTDRGSSPQHTQNPGPAAAGDGGDRAGRSGAAPGGAEPSATPKAKSKAKSKAKGPTDTGSRIALRNWRISTRLVSLLALPVVAATTLGGLRINESMNDMEQLDHIQLLTQLTQEATKLAQALQNERDMTAGPLSNGDPASSYKVTEPRKTADRAQKTFLDAAEGLEGAEGDEALQSIRANVKQIAGQVVTLGSLRQDAYNQKSQDFQTVERYNRLINSLLSLSQDMAQATSNPEMIKRTRALAAFSSAKEYASIQRAIIAAGLKKTNREKGELDPNDREYGAAALDNENHALDSFRTIYSSAGGDAEELLASLGPNNPSIVDANEYAESVLRNPNGMKLEEARGWLDWTDADEPKMKAMNTIEATLLGEMESTARELRQEEQRDAIINGALILLVLGVSLVGAFVVARSMIRSLRRLQDTATKVAQERLPELVKQLSEADPQDVDTSVESVGVHSRDEIGKVAAAFDDVHREAVRLAAEQALLRGNVNAMFTNLSRRSQGLIQRQLSLISELESREADPDQLSSLFKLDHLATRMRRNGENLLVLAGEEPGRRWTRPVPLVDVLRAAASEVEQYERIELAAVPATEVAGRVVNDLVHLLAELLENATSFSSPQTKVRVTGHALPDGRVLVEIHDTGIGLSPEDLAAINERLASPPTVDVSVSRRMGLFVVGRLSLRHGIRIQLRPSDSGGTTALVMLPVDVAQGGKVPGKPGGPGGQGAMPQGPAGSGGRLTGGPGAAGGGRPGLPGGPGGAGGAGGSGAPAGRHSAGGGMGAGAGGGRGQVGAGAGSRAALPGRDDAGRPGGPQGGSTGRPGQAQTPEPQSQRQGTGLAGAFGASSGGGQGGGRGTKNSGIPTRSDVWQSGPAEQQGTRNNAGAPRPELPGGGAQRQRPQRPQTPSWGAEATPVPPQQRTPLDAPRGHEEPETTGHYARPPADRQGPGATAEFARPDLGAQARPGAQDPAATAQFAQPDHNAPRPPAPSLPAQQQPEALPPAPHAGDGRTPLYDTLETNWFHGQDGRPAGQPQQTQQPQQTGRPHQAPQQPQQPQRGGQQSPGRGRPQGAQPQGQGQGQGGGGQFTGNDQTMPTPVVSPRQQRPGQGSDAASTTASWRTSPNDELVRQAERVRKPAAGGVTTSGLPRRVPRANLVPGTAQEQTHQSGPQVSRAPDDVRGRLTNLRRGIQQGRQAGSSTTGSFNSGHTHQQER
ncbi:nitrate- and nitrite sensing domain-containing protein [Streptomyces ficellus]|uniref:histidine kinase n=1 Tax=Streptomyces ficellus TaxID=1977088 RepID=A0ABT7Z459_9ACTN|nr:nitrate- and nitrite sensing domain-containing protein [Streptomyces ficellus]MDN3294284.1 nitrate- and nitrite sensing domain-containing protein [Streptomyces ficellus]